MNNTEPPEKCVGCGSPRIKEFFQADKMPVNCGSISTDRREALNARVGQIRLVHCPECDLIHNQEFDDRKVDFKPGYEVALLHSKTFAEFINGVAERLIEKYALRGKKILEIGCGDGSFLRLICQAGGNTGIGIDPTVVNETTEQLQQGSVQFIRDYFDEKYTDLIGDFVCCLSVFEDISCPLEFLKNLRKMIGSRDVGLYFEVFNGFRSLEQGEIWSIHYEQCNYFSLETLKHLFVQAGFAITDADYCYQGGQYLYVEATPSQQVNPIENNAVHENENQQIISGFASRYARRRDYWNQRLAELRSEGKSVVVWGSGGKGISFLNAVDSKDNIKFVIDINPNRQGRFIPGTAQEIIGPERIIDVQPDLIILTNPLYEQEIRRQVSQLGLNPEFDIA